MCCKKIWVRIILFTLAAGLGLLAVNILQGENSAENKQEKSLTKILHDEDSLRISEQKEVGLSPFYTPQFPKIINAEKKSLYVISKPIPVYTKAARRNQIQGVVRLRVIFLASGEIGDILPVNNLPDGLTEQAITAARQIKFKPAIRNGKPTTVTSTVEYNFTIY